MKKNIIMVITAAVTVVSMNMAAYAMTAQEAEAGSPAAYTAGNGSVYGPSLSQSQLDAVAQAAADFVSGSITEGMSRDEKIRAAHDYLVNMVEYAPDWRIGSANTAYGALINHSAQCSGYSRAFQALCDAMGVPCRYIHADAAAMNPSHQWNMAEFSDGWFFVDVQTNDSSRFDAVYHAKTHPMSYDAAAFPEIGTRTSAEPERAETQGWRQDAAGWWYRNGDGSYPQNTWKEIDGRQYYFDGGGYMLSDTVTPDGFRVGQDGARLEG